jgi:uncharacterized membrane protein YkvA (DUF1232 family)
LDAFPEWLKTLGDDAKAYASILERQEGTESVRRNLAGAVNYLFKSLDLIPDGIEDLGFIDDAFVLRAAALRAVSNDDSAKSLERLSRLADEAALVREFLGENFERLERFVANLESTTARGRAVDAIVTDDSVREELVNEVTAWADSYQAPAFSRDEKNLIKLKAFLATKLPS